MRRAPFLYTLLFLLLALVLSLAVGAVFISPPYQGEEVKIPVITDFIKNQGWV